MKMRTEHFANVGPKEVAARAAYCLRLLFETQRPNGRTSLISDEELYLAIHNLLSCSTTSDAFGYQAALSIINGMIERQSDYASESNESATKNSWHCDSLHYDAAAAAAKKSLEWLRATIRLGESLRNGITDYAPLVGELNEAPAVVLSEMIRACETGDYDPAAERPWYEPPGSWHFYDLPASLGKQITKNDLNGFRDALLGASLREDQFTSLHELLRSLKGSVGSIPWIQVLRGSHSIDNSTPHPANELRQRGKPA